MKSTTPTSMCPRRVKRRFRSWRTTRRYRRDRKRRSPIACGRNRMSRITAIITNDERSAGCDTPEQDADATVAPPRNAMITVDEHQRAILASVQPLDQRTVPLAEALGSTLRAAVHAAVDLPLFDN